MIKAALGGVLLARHQAEGFMMLAKVCNTLMGSPVPLRVLSHLRVRHPGLMIPVG